MRAFLAIAAILSLLTPVSASADNPDLRRKRADSCGGGAFATTDEGGYTHRRFGVSGPLTVGGATLEWCQTAQNAVVYFYVGDPAAPDDKRCYESMSFAVFPGIGRETREIVEGNARDYYLPGTRLVDAPKVFPSQVKSGARTIDVYELTAVVEVYGLRTRKRMIGYAHGDDFVRVMTGNVEDEHCSDATVRRFLAELKWP